MTHSEQVLRTPRERETVNGAVRALRSAAPLGWTTLTLEFRATVGIDSALFEITSPDGTVRAATPPGRAVGKMDELRRAMYRRGKGAWFTARLEVERSGRWTVEFDYDAEPDFTPPLPPAAYAQDLDRFPRAEEHIPGWLGDKLRRARASGNARQT
ncbi:hypothetical protein ACSNOI_35295 [Actinomadura kijaniata]|uniref:hypothetical protein n=1 Tax=Actinomadura kijaniata TaxID=46161 RepID=UPI003F1AC4C2